MFKRKLRGNQTHRKSGVVASPQEPTGVAAVMRFQGKFTCGCPWPLDQLAPEECPDHEGAERVYQLERTLEMHNVRVEEEVAQ